MSSEKSIPRPLPTWSQARWASKQRHAQEWKCIGASAYVIRMLVFGIWDPPTRRFVTGRILSAVPQTADDLAFALLELKEGCKVGTYQQISKEHAMDQLKLGSYISSAFVDWQQEKPRFIINLKVQLTHWDKKSVQMENLGRFATNLKQGDHSLSFDWKSGYRHFRLHSKVCNLFIFRYQGKPYRCISLPFGWTRSPFWFCHLLSPLTRYMRSALRYRVLQWIDDYLIAPGDGATHSSAEACQQMSAILNQLFLKLGLFRHPDKGVWGSATTKLKHLGVTIDTAAFRFFITEKKLRKLQDMATCILRTAGKSQRWVREKLLTEFTGKTISQLLPLPLARFFTRALYDHMRKDRRRIIAIHNRKFDYPMPVCGI